MMGSICCCTRAYFWVRVPPQHQCSCVAAAGPERHASLVPLWGNKRLMVWVYVGREAQTRGHTDRRHSSPRQGPEGARMKGNGHGRAPRRGGQHDAPPPPAPGGTPAVSAAEGAARPHGRPQSSRPVPVACGCRTGRGYQGLCRHPLQHSKSGKDQRNLIKKCPRNVEWTGVFWRGLLLGSRIQRTSRSQPLVNLLRPCGPCLWDEVVGWGLGLRLRGGCLRGPAGPEFEAPLGLRLDMG
mmetsp:Transcript_35505/g.58001  ORF Transcript_35505/g.58001 Transcript_35505/m.58001 type:complete len:240 (+) Transcript_35505:572-1291(+)